VLVSPAIYGNIIVSSFLLETLKFIHSCGGGWLSLGPAADTSHFSSKEEFDNFKKDKYCYSGRLTLSMGNTLLCLTEVTQQLCNFVEFPYCLFHSLDDPVVQVRGSQELYTTSKTLPDDKVYYEYKDLGHMVLCDEDAFYKCMKWFQLRSGKFLKIVNNH